MCFPRVTGQELLDEEMIKLPLNIATSGISDWKALVTRAKDKRQSLQNKAEKWMGEGGDDRLIRPIVLVQVERTGKEQRGAKAGGKVLVHSEDVREYLTERVLGVSNEAVKVKTAEDDGLEDVDLMHPECPVQWIITKSALQEGWDCPFAYILVSLNNTGSAKAMTQLVGRVLRQPFQERLPDDYADLNESYVYCLHQSAGELPSKSKRRWKRKATKAICLASCGTTPMASPSGRHERFGFAGILPTSMAASSTVRLTAAPSASRMAATMHRSITSNISSVA